MLLFHPNLNNVLFNPATREKGSVLLASVDTVAAVFMAFGTGLGSCKIILELPDVSIDMVRLGVSGVNSVHGFSVLSSACATSRLDVDSKV
jgi:hypothetical protein